MNGRVYDYQLGRFLSVDPFIQEPGNSQSMNPYSYIMNNPLAGTDPSGYIAEKKPKPEDKEDDKSKRRDHRSACKVGTCGNIPRKNGANVIVTFKNGKSKKMKSSELEGVATRDVQSVAGYDEEGNPMAYSFEVGASGGTGDVSTSGSRTGGEATPVLLPSSVKLEASGFRTPEEAAKSAGLRYGPEGVERKQEFQLGIVKLGDNNWGYLTPGWGGVKKTAVDFTELDIMYMKAGYNFNYWMHGHWDSQSNFSALDFPLGWHHKKTFLVNKKLEVRVLTKDYLEDKHQMLGFRHKRLGKPYGLQVYYEREGLPGEIIK